MDCSSFKTSLGKKLIAVALCVTAFVFLSFSVFGTTYNPTTYNTFSDSITVSNVTYSLRVTQFKALSTGTSMLPSGMETIMFVVFQITNDNDQDALCQVPQFNIDLSDQRVITDVYTYAGDLALGITSNGFIVLPTEPYSYDASNKIVVPSNSTLTLVGGIGLPAQLNQTGDGTLDTGLRNVHLLYKPYTVTLGSYSHGTPIDITPIIQYIDGIESTLSTISNNVNDINLNIADIILGITNINNNISYSGNNYQYIQTSAVEASNVTKELDGQNLFLRHQKYIFKSYVNNIDVNYNNSSDVTNVVGTEVYDVYYYLTFVNRSQSQYRSYNFIQLSNLIPINSSVGEVTLISPLFDKYSFYRSGNTMYMYLYYSHPNGEYGILNQGDSKTVLHIKLYAPIGSNLTFNNNDDVLVNGVSVLTDSVYYPNDEYSILRDLYTAYSKVNGLDDIDDIADEVTDKSESAHTQEQTYFTQNAQAIQQTGLNNYRFNSDQENGISSVSHDFILLWNSLGGFNSVYVFSLTLSLALMILRHAPNAIKSYRRNKEE